MEDTNLQREKAYEKESNDIYNRLMQEEKETVQHNTKLLLDNNVPDDEFKMLLEHCNINGRIEIVSEPQGQDQDEDGAFFKKVFVDQWTVGLEGDSFEGFIYGKIAKGKWLKVPYSC